MRGLVVLLTVSGLLAAPTAAWAQGAVDVAWDAPAACPSAVELLARIEDLAPGALAPRPISARVAREGREYVARVEAGEASRELRASRCDVLTSAVALVVATTMLVSEPIAPMVEVAPSVAEPTESRIEVAEDASYTDEVEDEEPRSPEALRPTASTLAGAAIGPLPDAQVLTMVSVGIRTGGFEMAFAWFQTTALSETARESGGGILRLGWILSAAPFELAFHFAGALGSVWAGRGNEGGGSLWGAIGAGLEARLWLHPAFGLSIFSDVMAPVTRFTTPMFGASPEELPTVTAMFGAGVVAQIP